MPVAIFYEILWLDLFPAGTYVPPNGTLSVFLVLALAYVLDNAGEYTLVSQASLAESPENFASFLSPATLFVPLVLAMPAAKCASRLESYVRHLSDTRYDQLLSWLEGKQAEAGELAKVNSMESHPKKLIITALFQSILVYMATFVLCFFVLFITFYCITILWGQFPQHYALFNDVSQRIINWPMLWFAALIGALLALRIKKAYIAYGATILVLFASFFFLK